MKELLELEERLKQKNIEIIEKVEPWAKEEEGERNRLKASLINLQSELDLTSKEELNNKIDLKLIKMKEEKEEILKNKNEELKEKMKFNVERSLENMKGNAEKEDIKINNIKERAEEIEEKVKKRKKLKAIESKNKVLYLDLLREDNMDNLKTIEKKREYEREKLISKLMEKDKKIMKLRARKREMSERMRTLDKKLNEKKSYVLNKARLILKSGKYRNSSEITSEIFDNNETSSYLNHINKTENE